MQTMALHPTTRLQLEALLQDPPQALLFVAAHGTGKRSVATAWARQLTADIEVIEPDDKGTISIDTVRSLYQRTRSKLATHQIVLIDHAEAMGVEAQNAFLKLLEEPRSGVTFILTAPQSDALLPTIVSRVQTIHISPLGSAELKNIARTQQATMSPQELTQALFIAQGRPAMLVNVLTNNETFASQRTLMQTAKRLMTASKYERLAMVSELIKNREHLVAVLEAMAYMTKLQLTANPERRWLNLADGLQTCLERLAQSGNPRIQLLRLLVLY